MKLAVLLMVILISSSPVAVGDEELSRKVDLLLEKLQAGDLSLSRSASLALKALGDEGRLFLLSRLGAEDSLTRRKAVLGLEAIGERSSVDPMIGLVDDPDPGVRSASIKALGHLKAERAFRPILASLDDPHHRVRADAVGALADLGSRQAIKPILGAASDPSEDVRGSVAYAIGRLGDRSASALLCLKVLVEDEAASVRRNAAISLGEIGDQRVEKDLVAAMSDEDPWVRNASARALGSLKIPSALHKAWDSDLSKLRGLLKDEKSQVRASAAEVLGELGDGESIVDLASLLDDEAGSGMYLYSSMRELSVAEVAAISLGRITGNDLGYERELPEEERQKALERWREWRRDTVESLESKIRGKK